MVNFYVRVASELPVLIDLALSDTISDIKLLVSRKYPGSGSNYLQKR